MNKYAVAICNYCNMVVSKLHIVSGLKKGMVKMSQNPDLFLTMINSIVGLDYRIFLVFMDISESASISIRICLSAVHLYDLRV